MARSLAALLLSVLLAGCIQAQLATEDAAGQDTDGGQQPWIQPLNECMAAGNSRTECFEKLPPDILARFEAWEAERAKNRRRLFQQRQNPQNSPAFGVEPDDPGNSH